MFDIFKKNKLDEKKGNSLYVNIGALLIHVAKVDENYSKSNLGNLPSSAAFFSDRNEIINDRYQLINKELISIITPIGGG